MEAKDRFEILWTKARETHDVDSFPDSEEVVVTVAADLGCGNLSGRSAAATAIAAAAVRGRPMIPDKEPITADR